VWVFKKPNQREFLNWRGYLASLALTAICTLIIYLIQAASISIHAEILYILAVVLTAFYFGLLLAIFTSVLSVLVYDYFFIPPLYSLGPRFTQDIPILVAFLLVGIIVSFIALKMRESEEKFRSMVETANEGIAMANVDGIILYVNQRFLDMLGYSPDEMLGRPIVSFADKDYAGELQQRLENRKRGIGEGYEMAFRRRGGDILWVRINGSPLFDLTENMAA
jgi:PAS domain S-box-containing protein